MSPLARLLRAVLFTVPVCLSAVPQAAFGATYEDTDLQALLEKSDALRFPREGFQVDVSIASSNPDKEPEVRKYRILSKGNASTLVSSTAPESERGRVLLMKSRDLWIFLPDISQPVRLSLSQRLTGEVANGDLARANFGGDYTPKLVRSESVAGEEYLVLELNANDRSVTYHRILYWVRPSDGRPLKSEFYSVSDRLLKTCRYENFQSMAGAMRPTRLVMEDALKNGDRSVLDYTNMRLRDLPDKMFTKDYLKKID